MNAGLQFISEPAYNALPGVRSSQLKLMLKSPAHFKEFRTEETEALLVGRAVHCAILEPQKYDDEFIYEPDGIDRRTKAGKEAYAEFLAAADGKTILSRKHLEMVEGVKESASKSELLQQILADSTLKEVTSSTIDNFYGLDIKARADILDTRRGAIYDVKTIGDFATEKNIVRAIINYRYDFSAAYYKRVFEQATGQDFPLYGWVFVEKKPPYGIRLVAVDADSLKAGQDDVAWCLDQLKRAIDTDHWPQYKQEFSTIKLPEWFKGESDND